MKVLAVLCILGGITTGDWLVVVFCTLVYLMTI